jgi:hypothetical protein
MEPPLIEALSLPRNQLLNISRAKRGQTPDVPPSTLELSGLIPAIADTHSLLEYDCCTNWLSDPSPAF